MAEWIPFWPRTAAVNAVAVNTLYLGELAVCAAIMALVVGMMLTFCVRYRRGSTASRAGRTERSWYFEIGWTTGTLVAFLGLFVWGAAIYIWLYQAPHGDVEIFVVGKQWMWKFEHPGGQSEIDALHVPVNRTIRLVMASQDVIHSFFVPAFRIKHDVVPGTLETLWFKATEPGSYKLECTQLCGVQHATMTGEVVVMPPQAYGQWLADQGASGSIAQQGEAAFRKYGCSGCHGADSTVHAPSLAGLYGSLVHLQDGSVRRADEQYLEDCILNPRNFTVAGYPPVMPSFAGQIGADDLMKLIAYIQSLGTEEPARWSR